MVTTVVSCFLHASFGQKCGGQVWGCMARGSWSNSCTARASEMSARADFWLTALVLPPVLCTTYFCRGLSLCVTGREAVMASLPQAELCLFSGSVGLVSLAGKSKWLVPNLSLPACCPSSLKLIASAYGLLWLSVHILHVSGIKSPVKEVD